jgi:hypothetical protein
LSQATVPRSYGLKLTEALDEVKYFQANPEELVRTAFALDALYLNGVGNSQNHFNLAMGFKSDPTIWTEFKPKIRQKFQAVLDHPYALGNPFEDPNYLAIAPEHGTKGYQLLAPIVNGTH